MWQLTLNLALLLVASAGFLYAVKQMVVNLLESTTRIVTSTVERITKPYVDPEPVEQAPEMKLGALPLVDPPWATDWDGGVVERPTTLPWENLNETPPQS